MRDREGERKVLEKSIIRNLLCLLLGYRRTISFTEYKKALSYLIVLFNPKQRYNDKKVKKNEIFNDFSIIFFSVYLRFENQPLLAETDKKILIKD